MSVVRLGVVAYLNAQPLVRGLDRHADRFALRFDAPSVCATRLGEGAIDVGTIPSIEYARGDGYRIVPGIAIASRGPVASVALYSRTPVAAVRSIATDTSSRTSVALLRVLCARHFGIDPVMVPAPPDPARMLERCEAALVIGDAALFLDHEAAGLRKIDLGGAWTDLTGLPFVWAVWAGREGALTASDVEALQAARDAGVRESDAIATAHAGGDPARADIGRRYLRENMRYDLDEDAVSGMTEFFRLAAGLGLAPEGGPLRTF
jgi:chorismate dehydratase